MADIVFVHGWPLFGATWKRVADELPGHRCHLVDLPGAPHSDWDEQTDFSARGMARWLEAWVTAQGISSYALVAFDSGAFIARLLAAADPRVTSLVLSNTEVPHHRPPWLPFYQRAIGLPGADRLFAALLGSRAYLRSAAAFSSCYADIGRIDEEFRATFVEPLRTPRGFAGMKRFLSGFDYGAVDRAAEVHARIRAPVHLVWGQDDATFPVSLLARFAPSFPTLASVKTVPGKLLVHDEQPAVYANVVRNALASVECGGIGSQSAKKLTSP